MVAGTEDEKKTMFDTKHSCAAFACTANDEKTKKRTEAYSHVSSCKLGEKSNLQRNCCCRLLKKESYEDDETMS